MRRVEYRLRRTIVLLKQDSFRIRKVLFKLENLRYPPDGTRKCFARRHPRHKYLLFFRQESHESKLQRVGILILINQDVLIRSLYFSRVSGETRSSLRSYQKIIKIQRIRPCSRLHTLEDFRIRRRFSSDLSTRSKSLHPHAFLARLSPRGQRAGTCLSSSRSLCTP